MPLFRALAKNMAARYAVACMAGGLSLPDFRDRLPCRLDMRQICTTLQFSRRSETSVCAYSVVYAENRLAYFKAIRD